MAESIVADLHVLLALYMRALVLMGLVASSAYGFFLGDRRSVRHSVSGGGLSFRNSFPWWAL